MKKYILIMGLMTWYGRPYRDDRCDEDHQVYHHQFDVYQNVVHQRVSLYFMMMSSSEMALSSI